MQWVRVLLLFPRVKRPERELNTHLVPRLRMSGAVPLLPLCLHGVTEASFYFYLYNPTRFIKGWNLVCFLREECKFMSIEEREF
jgi:hypothetical protein